MLSNESINIWSHLVGFVFFFYLLLADNLVRIPENNGTFSDHVVLALLLIGFMVKLNFMYSLKQPEKTANILMTPPISFPWKMMSEDDAQKFHIGEVSFPSDKSSVWNFSAHSLDIISQGNF